MNAQGPKNRSGIIIFGLAIYLLSLSVGWADICYPDPKANPQPPHTIQDLFKSAMILRSFDNQKESPSELRDDLSALDDIMEAYALESLNEDAKKNLPVSHTQERINSDFKKLKLDNGGLTDAKIKKTGDDYATVYADWCGIEFGPVDPETGYLPFKTTISIQCGNRIGFGLLRKNGTAWEPILCDFRSDEKSTINYLKYIISHRKDEAADYVVVARVSTWCTSVWQRTYLSIFRIENGSENYIFTDEFITVADSNNPEDDMILKPLPKGFSLKVSNGDGAEPGFRFPHTYEFTIENGMVSNIAIRGDRPKN